MELLISDHKERVQLIRALTQRYDFLKTLNPILWDANDSQGSLDECISATARILKKTKEIKIQNEQNT